MRDSGLLDDADLPAKIPGAPGPGQRPAPAGGYARGVEITRRNLIYHVAPFHASNVWRLNVAQLRKRLDQGLFNGRKVVAISTGPELDPPEAVAHAFGSPEIEFITKPNCRRMRENATFQELMERVESSDPREATWYGHAKGVCTTGDEKGVTWWRNGMYHKLLDDWPAMAALLANHPIVGTHRMEFGGTFPDNCWSPWHFSGTYWWFRNADVFGHARWLDHLPKSGWGVEALPGLLFPIEASACVWMENCANPYNPRAYTLRIDDDEPELGRSAALKIELGGGSPATARPKPDGYVNVDLDESADVRLDLGQADLRLPFEDGSVWDVYSSHLFEHLDDCRPLLREIVRVGAVGCRVEIRVPHWLSPMAMCHGHRHTISPEQVEHWCSSAADYWFGDSCSRRLRLYHTEHVPGASLAEWRKLLHQVLHQEAASDEQLMRLCPGACHEVRYVFHVVGQR